MAAVEASEANPSAAIDPQKSPPERSQDEGEASAPEQFHQMPDLCCENDDPSEDEAEKERQEKFKKYEAEYAHYLMAKYFSNKTYTGDNVFEEETKIENETIRSSRFPILSAFTNPAKHLQEKTDQMETSISTPAAETL